jgi:hypothetical protein
VLMTINTTLTPLSILLAAAVGMLLLTSLT